MLVYCKSSRANIETNFESASAVLPSLALFLILMSENRNDRKMSFKFWCKHIQLFFKSGLFRMFFITTIYLRRLKCARTAGGGAAHRS